MGIKNVSDTAKWVAEYRAMETDRPDAIFRDPYARRLAGPEGATIVANLPRGRQGTWAMSFGPPGSAGSSWSGVARRAGASGSIFRRGPRRGPGGGGAARA